jgi:hypothetical protein
MRIPKHSVRWAMIVVGLVTMWFFVRYSLQCSTLPCKAVNGRSRRPRPGVLAFCYRGGHGNWGIGELCRVIERVPPGVSRRPLHHSCLRQIQKTIVFLESLSSFRSPGSPGKISSSPSIGQRSQRPV